MPRTGSILIDTFQKRGILEIQGNVAGPVDTDIENVAVEDVVDLLEIEIGEILIHNVCFNGCKSMTN